MSSPPFRLASASVPARGVSRITHLRTPGCCESHASHESHEHPVDIDPPAQALHARLRLHQLHSHFHCSVIGTCLTTAELRKLVGRHVNLDPKASDQDVHSSAVGLSEQAGDASKALHKALDRRHAAALGVFAKARDSVTLARLWSDALDRGEVPGAYWALLTHHDTGDALRTKAFGDVHMLSHLVGASNRADIRRLVALEQANAELSERCDRQQARLMSLTVERDRLNEESRLAQIARIDRVELGDDPVDSSSSDAVSTDGLLRQVALQTERREKAEHRARMAEADARRAIDALAEMQSHGDMLNRELIAAEAALRQLMNDGGPDASPLRLGTKLQGRRLAYIGGRPSSTPAIRALVQRHGAQFTHHDGGLEDRKGLLTSTIVGADIVAFPMDCIDHDSVNMIKRLCARHGVAFLPLRTASATSLMSALAANRNDDDSHRGPICLKHG